MKNIIYSVLLSFLISSIIGLLLIPLFKTLKLGQYIREVGPKSHYKKAGTPTFGGIIFILSAIITMLIFKNQFNRETLFVSYAFLSFGLIGLIDDTLKIIHKKNDGLTSMHKLILLILVSFIFAFYAYHNSSIGTLIIIPFTGRMYNLGALYIPFVMFYYVATTNAVNLTDGLDGLAASITLLVIAFFSLLSFSMHYYSLAIFCGCVLGSLLGFLRYNFYPAKIIMGDTGAIALGGIIATIAIILKDPLILIIVGGIYVIETLSVIIQVVSFKLTGKRIFKMTPIHHSFELSGWHEVKIVSLFSFVTVILLLIAFSSF